jgi:hypothetical protein
MLPRPAASDVAGLRKLVSAADEAFARLGAAFDAAFALRERWPDPF